MTHLIETLMTIPIWLYASLFLTGIIAFIISTISGGGGALLMIPIVSWFIGTPNAPPVINLGTFIGRPVRLMLFWQNIHWQLVLYYAPFALLGAIVAGFMFSKLEGQWIQFLVGIFLVSTVVQYRFGNIDKTFNFPYAGFAPLGFIVAFISTLVGGLGPILNPFYLNSGLYKEDLIATKTANSFLVGIAQIGSYSFFGVLTLKLWILGVTLGLGAVVGNYLGKHFLAHLTVKQFRVALITLMVISGLVMIFKNLPF